jgi:hypothetical protein
MAPVPRKSLDKGGLQGRSSPGPVIPPAEPAIRCRPAGQSLHLPTVQLAIATAVAERTDIGLPGDPGPGDSRTANPGSTKRGAADPGSAPDERAAADPLPLASPTAGTTRDFATAMGMLGAEIVEQVETSVQSVLTENHQMRELAQEMADASGQAREQFKVSIACSGDAESAIERRQLFGTHLAASIERIAGEVRKSIRRLAHAGHQDPSVRRRPSTGGIGMTMCRPAPAKGQVFGQLE